MVLKSRLRYIVSVRRFGGVGAAVEAVLAEWLSMVVVAMADNVVADVVAEAVLLGWSRLAVVMALAGVVMGLALKVLVVLKVACLVATVLACMIVEETVVDGAGNVDAPKHREPFKRRRV